MKIAFILSVLTITQIWAADTYSQKTALTLNLDDVSISEVLNEIETQSQYYFIYSPNLIEVERQVSINVENESITNIIHQIFGESVKSAEHDRKILLVPVEDQSMLSALQQEREISGRVTDEQGAALIGVNVSIDGTTTGTITDFDGRYTITVQRDDAILVFSYIGFESQMIPVNGNSTIDVTMVATTEAIDEVVVIGYGTVRKSDLTGTVSSISTQVTQDIPNTNVLQSLQGSVAGLNVVSPYRPGEDPEILVRGINSISASNAPLIVLDGIIYNGSINDISVNDIKQIDILKDASAAAVYGSRSSNGVIIITTKMGTTDKPVFNFNAYSGLSTPTYVIPVKDAEGYVQKVLDFREASGLEADPANIEDYLSVTEAENYRNGNSIDWYSEIIKPGVTQSYDLNVSGRSDRTNYYLSGNLFDQKGIVDNDNFRRLTLKANFTNHITDWYSISLRTAFASRDYSGVEAGLYYGLSPLGNYWEDESQGIFQEFPMEDPFYSHPMYSRKIDNQDISTSLLGTLSSELSVPFIEGLKWTLNFSNNLRHHKINNFWDNTLELGGGKTLNGRAEKSIYENYDWTLDNIVSYKRTLLDLHAIDLTLLYSREYLKYESTVAKGNDFFNQTLGYNNLEMANVQEIESDFQDQNSVAYMARLNYVYDNRYALTATVRRDGFSGFSANNKYALFPSAALAWTISNERFMDNSALNLLKLRISYGKNGNQSLGRYQTLARISTTQYVFGETTALATYLESMANSDLGWETTLVQNLGIDFGLYRNRVNGSIDLYSSNTYDILLNRNIPVTSGYGSVWTNIGKVHNKGIEAAVNSVNIQSNDFSWRTGFIFTLNRNRIDALLGEDLDGDGIEDDNLTNSWFIGKPLGVIYGYKLDGIYQSDDTDIPTGFVPGDFRLVDSDQNSEITPEDRQILGSTLPNFTFSLSNTLNYKNFSLYFLIRSIQGGGKDNYYVGDNIPMHDLNWPFSSWTERFNVIDVPYWTPTNPSEEYARINYMANRPHPYLEDRSFVRVQDVSLAYTFDHLLLERMKLKGLRIYISSKNLYTWTKWTGYDPENMTTINNITQNTLGDFPMLRSFILGVDVKF